jgi:hypothetical protein
VRVGWSKFGYLLSEIAKSLLEMNGEIVSVYGRLLLPYGHLTCRTWFLANGITKKPSTACCHGMM